MSRNSFKNLIVYIIILTLILTGCGKTLQIIDKESSSNSNEDEKDFAENMDEKIPEGNPEEKEKGTLLNVLTDHSSNDSEDKEVDHDEFEDEDRGEIPEDYPHKDAPFYSGQLTLELATDIMIGETKVYSVIFSTADDMDKVKEEIIDTYTSSDYEVIVNMEQMGALTLMVEKNKYNIMIIVAEDEGLDEATMVEYTVSPSDD